MNCKEFSNHLMDYVEGLLPHSQEAVMNEHIKHCDVCRLRLEKVKKVLAILKEDKVPQLSEAKKNALFPIVMERIEQRSVTTRRKRKWAYGLSFGLALILVFIISIIGIQNRGKTDLYTLFFDHDRFIYENDTNVNSYLLETFIKDDALITDITNEVDEAWMDKSELAVLINELSEEEINKLVEKLKSIDFKDML